MQSIISHFVEEGIFGGAGYFVIRALGFGRIQADYGSPKLLRTENGRVVLGWFLVNVVGVLFWIGVAAMFSVFIW